MCGWPPYIDVQVCRVDIGCNGGYVDGHHVKLMNIGMLNKEDRF